MPAESSPSSPPSWWSARASGHAACAAVLLGAATLLWAVVQMQFGIFGHREWTLPAAAKIRTDGLAFKARLPEWGQGALAGRRVMLLRDGKPVGTRVNHARTVVDRGGGTFKIQREQLYFSLPENEDPRPDIRSFSVSLPRPVKPIVWIAGGALLLIGSLGVRQNAHAQHLLASASDKLNATPAVALVSGVFLIALITTLARLPDAMTYSDGSFSVKGVPYTDAAGWDELAANLAEGRGFAGGISAQRPLYPAMLGMLYTVTGQSLLVAKALNAFWLALAAAAVCALSMAGGSRVAGLAAALGVIIGNDYVSFSHLLLTETSGLAFGTAAVLALVIAIASPSMWRIILASLLLACANLASGFGLFAVLGYGAVALATWWSRQGMKKALAQSLVLAGVVALAWMPWLIRQHAVHGVWNLSTSSANLMFAAAAPEHGTWNEAVASEWKEAGVPNEEGARYKFYMEKYAEAVKAHPAEYARAVVRGMHSFAEYWIFEGPDRFGVVLLGLLAGTVLHLRRQRPWRVLLAAALVIAGCTIMEGQSAGVVWSMAAVLTLLTCPCEQRPLWALIAITVPFVAVLAGVTGGNLGRRMWTACEWTMPLLLVMGGTGAMRLIAACRQRPGRVPEPARPLDARVVRIGTGIGLVLMAHAVLGSMAVTGLHLLHGDAAEARLVLSADDRTKAHELASAHFDFLKGIAPGDARFLTEPCRFGEYVCELEAWEDEQHWARSFEVRPYSRTVGFAAMLDRGGNLAVQMPTAARELPRGVPLLIIGVLNHDAQARLGHDADMAEVLGWVPMEHGSPSWSHVIWLHATPEAVRVMQAP